MLPDHSVPRGGRPTLRPARDHRPRQDRARRGARRRSRQTFANAAGAARSRPSTTSSSTRPGARATAPRASPVTMSATLALGQRSLREAIRQPDALFMTMFIPIFFLIVNPGQAAEIFPSDSTGFLEARGTARFPASDHPAPSRRRSEWRRCSSSRRSRAATSTSCGRSIRGTRSCSAGSWPRAPKCVVISSVIVLIALPFGRDRERSLGFVLLVVMTSLWGVVYAGFMQLIALKTRSAAATNSGGLIFFPLLFPDAQLRPPRPAHRADGGRRDAGPGHLPHAGALR